MKTQLRLGLFLVMAFGLFSPTLVAQDTNRVTIDGTLVNGLTGEPIRGAEITLQELDLHVLSDSVGSFRLSNLPLGRYHLSVRAVGFRSVDGDFRVERPGAFTIRLDPVTDVGQSDTGQVRGTVLDLASGDALESAQVTLPSVSRTTLTDEHGRFSFRGVPPGRQLIVTEYLGYRTRTDSLSVPPGHLVSVEVGLSVAPVELDPIRVEVEPQLLSLDLAGFYDRRDAVSGIFLTRDQIVSKQPLYTTDVFNSLPGVRVVGSTGLDRAVVLRAGARLSLSGQIAYCGPTVYLDGLLYERGGPGSRSAFLDRIVRPEEIAGIEVYTSPATVPLQYTGMGSDCGVIVIWTR